MDTRSGERRGGRVTVRVGFTRFPCRDTQNRFFLYSATKFFGSFWKMDAKALPPSSINESEAKPGFFTVQRRFLHLLLCCEMAESDVARQLNSFVASLKNQGTLDECYDALVNLKEGQHPKFLLETITLFFKESDMTIYDVHRTLNKYPIEFSNVITNAHKLKGSCASIGGSRMASACKLLLQACGEENMGRTIDAFSKVKCEYEVLRQGLGHIGRMEQKLYTMKQGGRA